MITPLTLWITTAVLYTVFWTWYVGFRRKITPSEAAAFLSAYSSSPELSQRQLDNLERFFTTDDGKDFVMVNLLDLKKPIKASSEKLGQYQKIFLGSLLRKAGHPVFMARAAVGNIENVDCENADNWTAAGMVRYRSRRDLMEILPATIGSEHHNLKLESLEKTFAFPSSQWMIMGGPRIVVALVLALIAALSHIILIS